MTGVRMSEGTARKLYAELRISGYGRAECEHRPPGHVVSGAGAEQRQRDERTDDEPERPGAEHQADQLAAVGAVGVLAHQHGADRVVAADAETEQEPERDQHPVRGRQRRPHRASHHDHRDHPVHPLTRGQVGEPAEHLRAECIMIDSRMSPVRPAGPPLMLEVAMVPRTSRAKAVAVTAVTGVAVALTLGLSAASGAAASGHAPGDVDALSPHPLSLLI